MTRYHSSSVTVIASLTMLAAVVSMNACKEKPGEPGTQAGSGSERTPEALAEAIIDENLEDIQDCYSKILEAEEMLEKVSKLSMEGQDKLAEIASLGEELASLEQEIVTCAGELDEGLAAGREKMGVSQDVFDEVWKNKMRTIWPDLEGNIPEMPDRDQLRSQELAQSFDKLIGDSSREAGSDLHQQLEKNRTAIASAPQGKKNLSMLEESLSLYEEVVGLAKKQDYKGLLPKTIEGLTNSATAWDSSLKAKEKLLDESRAMMDKGNFKGIKKPLDKMKLYDPLTETGLEFQSGFSRVLMALVLYGEDALRMSTFEAIVGYCKSIDIEESRETMEILLVVAYHQENLKDLSTAKKTLLDEMGVSLDPPEKTGGTPDP